MKDEIKIITLGNIFENLETEEKAFNFKDYITNLQEENKCLKGNCKRYHKKSNNQAEEINRLYKQREKFMKKYGYLKEENEKLKEDIEILTSDDDSWWLESENM